MFILAVVYLFFRVKQASRGKHEWASLPVPTSKNYLLVTGLLAGTIYQFSVLPQNKLGSGSFSEIVSVQTLGLCRKFIFSFSLKLCLHDYVQTVRYELKKTYELILVLLISCANGSTYRGHCSPNPGSSLTRVSQPDRARCPSSVVAP